jgi:hypothetical protein
MEIKLESIVDRLPVIETIGNIDRVLHAVISASNSIPGDHDILWISDKNIDLLEKIKK